MFERSPMRLVMVKARELASQGLDFGAIKDTVRELLGINQPSGRPPPENLDPG